MTRDTYGAFVTAIDRPAGDGPLHGLRLGVKDLIAVRGVPRLCGAPDMVDAAPQPDDAPVVARLASAGAQLVATTATHEFGWGVLTPDTRNPRAPDRIAGGSSAGSAAALAAGLVDGALGTDTAGSIRIPAACCGVVGLRPTHGALPMDGIQPLAPSFDTVGPMARDVATLARLFAVLSDQPVAAGRLAPVRLGIVPDVADAPLDAQVAAAVQATVAALGRAARRADVGLPGMADAGAATMLILAAEEATVHRGTLATHGDRLSPGVRAALERAAALPNEEVLAARRSAALWRSRMVAVFRDVDVLLVPVLPCTVPAVGERSVIVDGAAEPTTKALTRLSTPWSLAGLPAGAVPVGRDDGGAPIGLQVIGRWGQEATVLAVMAMIEAATGGPWPPVGS